MIICHNCILDLRGIFHCYPFAINDEHSTTSRVWGSKIFVIAIDDYVAGSFVLARDIHVDVHLYRGWEIFLMLVLVLVGVKPFKVGRCFHFVMEFVTS